MAKKDLKPKTSERTAAQNSGFPVKFLVDMKDVKKGTEATFGIDTAVGLAVRGIVEMTSEKGKQVMDEIKKEELEIQKKREKIAKEKALRNA
jgi:hypothetical protein